MIREFGILRWAYPREMDRASTEEVECADRFDSSSASVVYHQKGDTCHAQLVLTHIRPLTFPSKNSLYRLVFKASVPGKPLMLSESVEIERGSSWKDDRQTVPMERWLVPVLTVREFSRVANELKAQEIRFTTFSNSDFDEVEETYVTLLLPVDSLTEKLDDFPHFLSRL